MWVHGEMKQRSPGHLSAFVFLFFCFWFCLSALCLHLDVVVCINPDLSALCCHRIIYCICLIKSELCFPVSMFLLLHIFLCLLSGMFDCCIIFGLANMLFAHLCPASNSHRLQNHSEYYFSLQVQKSGKADCVKLFFFSFSCFLEVRLICRKRIDCKIEIPQNCAGWVL